MVHEPAGHEVGRRDELMMVTGGATGIGASICAHAADAGFRVIAIDRDDEALERLDLPGVTGARLDVTDRTAYARWFAQAVDDHGPPGCFVNNAGILRPGALEDLSGDDWQAVIDVNLTAVFTGTQLAGRAMLRAGRGSIVSIASIASIAPSVGAGAYPSAKAGVAMLMEMAAIEWGPRGVRANTVSPGPVRTNLAAEVYADEDLRRAREQAVPLQRLGSVDDVAAAVLFLCSPGGAFINGHNLVVDGGITSSALRAAPRSRAEL